jgi:hypothetical protein
MRLAISTVKVNVLIGIGTAARWVHRRCVRALEAEKAYWEAMP